MSSWKNLIKIIAITTIIPKKIGASSHLLENIIFSAASSILSLIPLFSSSLLIVTPR
ncbi:MAG: hypothetical protein LBM96_10395 [Methanobrevibacter sp.]|nr:hypothetical protein [Candidatus Methanoflexus mossambicus]